MDFASCDVERAAAYIRTGYGCLGDRKSHVNAIKLAIKAAYLKDGPESTEMTIVEHYMMVVMSLINDAVIEQ